jgi:hypothetical protein
MLFRPALAFAAICGLLLTACEKKTDALSERRLQLLAEENVRLAAEVAKIDPDAARQAALSGEKSADGITRLTEANERLREIYRKAEHERAAAFNITRRGEIERAVEEIRGLKFKHPVEYSVLGRKDIKSALTKRMNAVFSDDEFAEQANALFRLGLLPEKYPLKERLIALLGEQVAAFYDQHEHRLYMYDDATLENSMNQMILAHELMHAMQDQHVSLKTLPLEEKRNDDRAIGAGSLIEGEATLLMSDFMMRNPSGRMVLDNLTAMFVQNMDELAKAPRMLRESLIFPYQEGLNFCLAGFQRRGWGAMDEAYKRPPRSSTQVLHPEKFYGKAEEPTEITWADTKFQSKPAQWDNVLGELGIRILFADWHNQEVANVAAAGWRGDRYLSFESADSLVWKTAWANQGDAAEFFQAEKDLLARRYKAQSPVSVSRRWESNRPRALRLVMNDRAEVLLIDAASTETAAALEAQFGNERAVAPAASAEKPNQREN